MGLLEMTLIMVVSITTTLLSEFLSWYLVYRHEHFQELQRKLDKTKAQLEEAKQKIPSAGKKKNHERRIEQLEKDSASFGQQLTRQMMKIQIITPVLFIASYRLMSNYLYGVPVARLPFQPISFIQGLSHRGLEGEDYYECSYMFFFAMCSMAFKQTISSMTGIKKPNMSDALSQSWEQAAKQMEQK
eukprot:gb/GECG01016743.1/.p1 GENE.gb/GECG01016743.1/~~gb/GECG01016743.1/.p1  ORF type:complete len:187 (+),score=18.50 gb/GECG01016743.1/:1-561(+)